MQYKIYHTMRWRYAIVRMKMFDK